MSFFAHANRRCGFWNSESLLRQGVHYGADDADVAKCVMRGVERVIKFNGGAPAFPIVVQALVVACLTPEGGHRLLRDLDAVRKDFADSPMTRDLAAAAEMIGLTAISERLYLSGQVAAERLFGQTRCDAMLSYVVRHRTGNLTAGQSVIESIKANQAQVSATHDLATRMLHCSSKGLPAKAGSLL